MNFEDARFPNKKRSNSARAETRYGILRITVGGHVPAPILARDLQSVPLTPRHNPTEERQELGLQLRLRLRVGAGVAGEPLRSVDARTPLACSARHRNFQSVQLHSTRTLIGTHTHSHSHRLQIPMAPKIHTQLPTSRQLAAPTRQEAARDAAPFLRSNVRRLLTAAAQLSELRRTYVVSVSY